MMLIEPMLSLLDCGAVDGADGRRRRCDDDKRGGQDDDPPPRVHHRPSLGDGLYYAALMNILAMARTLPLLKGFVERAAQRIRGKPSKIFDFCAALHEVGFAVIDCLRCFRQIATGVADDPGRLPAD